MSTPSSNTDSQSGCFTSLIAVALVGSIINWGPGAWNYVRDLVRPMSQNERMGSACAAQLEQYATFTETEGSRSWQFKPGGLAALDRQTGVLQPMNWMMADREWNVATSDGLTDFMRAERKSAPTHS